ncbi:MAG: hypothetical protein K0M49_02325 [Arenimonas sp.]|nr:hypothetical protein [Rhizobium sp.]MBW8444443.1 hypothetical protein [Arenimonas sp.]
MISGRLTMRAAVERNQATGKDNWGNPLPPQFAALGTYPCFAWSNVSREVVDGDKVAAIEDMRAMFALSADITEDDEISTIADRKGAVLIAGRLKVEGPVQRKHTHLEVALKRIG